MTSTHGRFFLAFLFTLSGCVSAHPLAQAPESAPEQGLRDLCVTPEQAFRLLEAEQHEELAKCFSTDLSRKLPPSTLRAVWSKLGSEQGQLTDLKIPQKNSKPSTVQGVARFANGERPFSLTYDTEAKLNGIWFGRLVPNVPQEVHSAKAERDVVIGSNPWPVKGTFIQAAAAGKAPAVLILPGSGPADRNGRMGSNEPLRSLAAELAKSGFASLRVDKRTFAHRDAIRKKPLALGLREEYVDDAVVALKWLLLQPQVDSEKIVLAGHSLGGMVAPRIARVFQEETNRRLMGMILLATPARPLPEVIVSQATYLLAEGGQDAEIRDELRKLKVDMEDLDAPSAKEHSQTYLAASPAYWREIQGLDPVREVRSSALPTLVLHPGRDYQVSSRDGEIWKSESQQGKLSFVEFPNDNHIFCDGKAKPLPQEYLQRCDLDSRVASEISRWFLSLRR